MHSTNHGTVGLHNNDDALEQLLGRSVENRCCVGPVCEWFGEHNWYALMC